MWFPRWKPVLDRQSFAAQTSTAAAVQIPCSVKHGRELERESATGGRSSLWWSACIGLLFSTFIIILQVGNGGGFELANYAHTPSVATIFALLIRVLTAPLIFVLLAVVRNLLNRRAKTSTASALVGAFTFAMLLASILGGLVVYGNFFFSRDEAISGEPRKALVVETINLCVQKQRSFSQDATEAEINQYCGCVSEKIADGTTYRQLGLASALANQKKAEGAELACAIAGN